MKILVIRLVEIGDVLLSSVLCSTLKITFPDAQVDYLMYETSAPLFNGHSKIDNVITISNRQRKNPIRYLVKTMNIARQDYDLIIDATSTNKSELISLFARKTSIKIGRQKKWRGFSYTHKVAKEQLTGNKIEQRLAMLSPLRDLGHKVKYIKDIEMRVSAAERYSMREKMIQAGVDLSKKMIAFSVSAKLSNKKWCRSYMEQTIRHCLEHHDALIILIAGLPHEYDDACLVYESLERPANVFCDFSIKCLRELSTLISYCDVFIGNEGGPRHIAEALGIPTATVFAPCSRLAEWMPNERPWHQGIEWQSIDQAEFMPDGFDEIGDANYYKLYNSITPTHFIPIVDFVISQSTIQLQASA